MSPWAPAGFDRALCLLAPLAQGGLQTVPFLNSRPRAPLFLSSPSLPSPPLPSPHLTLRHPPPCNIRLQAPLPFRLALPQQQHHPLQPSSTQCHPCRPHPPAQPTQPPRPALMHLHPSVDP